MREIPVIVDVTEELAGKDVWFVGDIHNRMALLERFLDHIEFDPDKHAIISVGDLVDRGEDAVSVVNFFRQFGKAIRGNHERMWLEMLDFEGVLPYDDQGRISLRYAYLSDEQWRRNGHWPTLEQFAASPLQAQTWLDYFESLPTGIIYKDYLLIHAGVYPNKPFEQHTETDLVWVRKEYLYYNGIIPAESRMGKRLVTGHSDTWRLGAPGTPIIRPDRILLDVGAAGNIALAAYRANTGESVVVPGPLYEETLALFKQEAQTS